jgi:hypothetical protein
MNDLDSWYPVYLHCQDDRLFVSGVWKLCLEESLHDDGGLGSGRRKPHKLPDTIDKSSQSSDNKPSLVASESIVSTTSTDSN